MNDAKFSDLVGKTLTEARVGATYKHEDGANNEVTFVADDGTTYRLYHGQDCCEYVVIEDVSGEMSDLVGTPILVAEERVSEKDAVPEGCETRDDHDQWTFYTLRTIKGTVDIRWHGSSNGYYSVGVDFAQVSP